MEMITGMYGDDELPMASPDTPKTMNDILRGLSDVLDNYYNSRTIHLYEHIQPESAANISKLMNSLARRGHDPITLEISSPGGSVTAGHALMDVIRKIRRQGVRVIGVVYGEAASMAPLILQACSKRVASESAIFMVHGLVHFQIGDVRNLEAERKMVNNLVDYMAQLLGKTTKKNADYWRSILQDATPQYYTAEEALEIGLIDEIIRDDA